MRTTTLFRRLALPCLLALLCLVLFACATPRQGPPLPAVSLGLAGFSQPQNTGDLLAGFLADEVPSIDPKILPRLDALFEEVLRQDTKRSFSSGPAYAQCSQPQVEGRNSGRPTALAHWTAVGRCMNVDFLLVPHIIEFRERDGGDLGVNTPAHVKMDVFLIDTVQGVLVGRSHYDETQGSLSANLLDAGKFFSRGGKWVTAFALAREGMEKAVKELGL